MRNALLAVTLGVVGLVAASSWTPGAPPEAGGTSAAGFPPRADTVRAWPPPTTVRAIRNGPAAHKPANTTADELNREIARLGARPPRYPDDVRSNFEEAADLFRFMQDVLPQARSGDGASQYYVYTALEECRVYLGLDAAAAYTVYEHLLARAGWATDELSLADREYRRCRGFAGADLSRLVEAMWDDVPGAEVEYASVWFERAVQSGYPPALANLALRPFKFSQSERLALLQRAAVTDDPDVYWRLFGQASAQGAQDAISAPAVAWLILACRAGMDCREQALWYRAWHCSIDDAAFCPRGESAIEHYWYALPPHERLQAYRLALEAETCLQAGQLDRLPWPVLPGGGS